MQLSPAAGERVQLGLHEHRVRRAAGDPDERYLCARRLGGRIRNEDGLVVSQREPGPRRYHADDRVLIVSHGERRTVEPTPVVELAPPDRVAYEGDVPGVGRPGKAPQSRLHAEHLEETGARIQDSVSLAASWKLHGRILESRARMPRDPPEARDTLRDVGLSRKLRPPGAEIDHVQLVHLGERRLRM